MSQLQVNRINDASGGVLAPISSVFKNRIINGDCRIDQRYAGASVTPSVSTYTLDRWSAALSQTSKFSIQQNAGSVTPPAGFTNYLGTTSLASTSLGASDFYFIDQRIEGFNIADLGWGTANAATVTLSFWVRSSLTGTFGGALRNSAANRSYPFSYTISSANTWEQKSITIAGDTSGTWLTNNGVGISIDFSIGTGSTFSGTAGAWSAGNFVTATGATSVVGTNGATFYITGVQLEKGTQATSFEYRHYGTELALCQRYYEKSFNQATAPAQSAGSTGAFRFVQVKDANVRQISCGTAFFKASKRATPTVTLFNPEAANALPRNLQRALDWTTGGLGTVAASESVLVFNDWTTATSGGLGDDFTVQWTASAEL
jgi:hypothetical protein